MEVCRVLLSSGSKVNAQTPGGVAPLHRAAYCGHGGVVKVLLQAGADVALQDGDGRSSLHKVVCLFVCCLFMGKGRVQDLSHSPFK